MSGARPNVLLIMADQLAAGWLPAYGHPVVQAPTIDALAAGGTVFESAYCASPLCAPSRAALLTGRLPSRTGVYDNAAELPATVPTLAHRLRSAGYATALAGKMHFVGPDQLHGYERRLTTDIYPADVDWTPDWNRPLDDPFPWYHTMEGVLRPGVCDASMQLDYDAEVAFRAVRCIHDLARYGDGRPFFLTASFTHPHDPWEVPRRYWDAYEPGAIDMPAVPALPLGEADPHSRRLRAMSGVDAAGLTVEQIRTARHGYYAAVRYVDERIGEVMAALRATGLDRDTIVIFTADHGEMLGERGLWYKMAFFEAAARVPLIVRVPGGHGGARIAEPVSLLDVMPTVLDLVGEPLDLERQDGTSLMPLIEHRGTRAGPVVGEYLAEGVSAPAVMLRRGPYKFVACGTDPDQLFDLDADPSELANLAADPRQADVVASFRDELAARWDVEALRERVLASQRDRRAVSDALARGEYTAWDHEPRFDASQQYVRNRHDMYELQRRARLEPVGDDPR
jgi:choline-sulfatase